MIFKNKNLFTILGFLVVFYGQANLSQAMTIEESYQAIPHRQTTYQSTQSPEIEAEKAYLTELFALTDEAMRLRVTIMQELQLGQGMDMSKFNKVYDLLLFELHAMTPPKKLGKGQLLIYEAISNQRKFLNLWAVAPEEEQKQFRTRYHRSKHVIDAHKQLLKAYSRLMKAFPQETAHNKQAFYDHLCALDFL